MYMGFMVNRGDYGGSRRRYKRYKKQLKLTWFIYLKTRTTLMCSMLIYLETYALYMRSE